MLLLLGVRMSVCVCECFVCGVFYIAIVHCMCTHTVPSL